MGLLSSGVFVQVVSGWDTLPSWDRLRSDFTQEGFRLSLVNGANKSQKSEVEQENVYLEGEGKAKKGSSSQSEKKKKYLSKVNCFGCHKYGHYVSDFQEWKKEKKVGGSFNKCRRTLQQSGR